MKLYGEEHDKTISAALNYSVALHGLQRFEEAKSWLHRQIPVARRVHGEEHKLMLKMRWIHAEALYSDDGATLDDLREAVETHEDVERIARRVFGGAHPLTEGIGGELRKSRAVLAAREGDDVSSVCEGVAAMTPGDA